MIQIFCTYIVVTNILPRQPNKDASRNPTFIVQEQIQSEHIERYFVSLEADGCMRTLASLGKAAAIYRRINISDRKRWMCL